MAKVAVLSVLLVSLFAIAIRAQIAEEEKIIIDGELPNLLSKEDDDSKEVMDIDADGGDGDGAENFAVHMFDDSDDDFVKPVSLSPYDKNDDTNPPNFWSFMENLIPGKFPLGSSSSDSDTDKEMVDPQRFNPLARTFVRFSLPQLSSADGHEGWRRIHNELMSNFPRLIDDTGLMHFLSGDDNDDDGASGADDSSVVTGGQIVQVVHILTDDQDDEGENEEESNLGEGRRRGENSVDDLSVYDTPFMCSDVDNLSFSTATNPSNLYYSDRRTTRMDYLVFETSETSPNFNFRRDVVVHWVYTSSEGEQCEMPEPGSKLEFLLTRAASCDFDRDFKITGIGIPNRRNALSTSLTLEDSDLLNFLPGKFGVRLYFKCHHQLEDHAPSYMHAWTSEQQITLEYRRPSKPWYEKLASPEITLALVILAIGLISGLLAVFLWSKMSPPGTDGFQYAQLPAPEKIVKAKPTWV